MAPEQADPLGARYLRALGVPRRPPGREALAEIVAAHVTRVPFENVSKLLRFRDLGLARARGPSGANLRTSQ